MNCREVCIYAQLHVIWSFYWWSTGILTDWNNVVMHMLSLMCDWHVFINKRISHFICYCTCSHLVQTAEESKNNSSDVELLFLSLQNWQNVPWLWLWLWKVVASSWTIFWALKSVGNNIGHGKIMEDGCKVMESLLLCAQVIDRNVKLRVESPTTVGNWQRLSTSSWFSVANSRGLLLFSLKVCNCRQLLLIVYRFA